MAEIFLTVEDAFEITRGLIVVPGPLEAAYRGPRQFRVLLKMPDGSEQLAELTLEHVFQSPPLEEQEHRWVGMLRGMTKAAVPIGTQVWTVDA